MLNLNQRKKNLTKIKNKKLKIASEVLATKCSVELRLRNKPTHNIIPYLIKYKHTQLYHICCCIIQATEFILYIFSLFKYIIPPYLTVEQGSSLRKFKNPNIQWWFLRFSLFSFRHWYFCLCYVKLINSMILWYIIYDWHYLLVFILKQNFSRRPV